VTSVYIASTETFVGKSAVCATLLEQFRSAGYRIGYMKPVSVSAVPSESGAADEDAQTMRKLFNLPDAPETIVPVLATLRLIDGALHGNQRDYRTDVQQAYEKIAADRDIVVLEGVNTWAEGAFLHLSAHEVSEMLDVPVLLVSRYNSVFAADPIIAVQHYLQSRLVGVILNQVPSSQVDYVRTTFAPFLEQAGVPVVGIIPSSPELGAVSVGELTEELGATVIGEGDMERLIEHLTIGAMGADTALQFFRRKPNKAVITGGDRVDLQIAALETSTACLVLTGNVRPAQTVLDRAAQRKVPVLMVTSDTMSVVQRAEGLFGRMRFGRGNTPARFNELAGRNIDMQRLGSLLKLPPARSTEG
jgi:BioD-like phosphotransacetylase family protein